MTVLSSTVIGASNFRISITHPVISRESLTVALSPLLGKPINADTLAEARRIVEAAMQPTITVEEIPAPASLLIELPLYQHISKPMQVRALKIAAVIQNPRGFELHFENTRYVPIQVSGRWYTDWEPDRGGYYAHGYYADAGNGEPLYLSALDFEPLYTLIEVGS